MGNWPQQRERRDLSLLIHRGDRRVQNGDDCWFRPVSASVVANPLELVPPVAVTYRGSWQFPSPCSSPPTSSQPPTMHSRSVWNGGYMRGAGAIGTIVAA
jgi:hypothetical protein